jgi:hypothetical protein
MPTYPTDQQRLEAHEEAERFRERSQVYDDPRAPGMAAAAAQWCAAEVRSLRFELIAMHRLPEPGEVVEGQWVAGEFVPTPELLEEVPEGEWFEVGRVCDLALAAGSTAGYPRDGSAIKLTRGDAEGECFVAAEVLQQYRETQG